MKPLLRGAVLFFFGLGVGAVVMANVVGGETGTAGVSPLTPSSIPPTSGSPDAEIEATPSSQHATPSEVAQLAARLLEEQSAREKLAAELAMLRDDVALLQRHLQGGEAAVSAATNADDVTAAHADVSLPAEPDRAMVALGVPESVAQDVKRRLANADMQRLKLRDQAAREGWLGTEKYVQALRDVEGNVEGLRDELGDEIYDKFLYAMGEPNRVRISDVIDGSPAASVDIRPDDIILAYAGKRVFSWNELRQATTEGQPGDWVAVSLLRDGEPVDVQVPRGPLGVRLDASRILPQ
jgi:membrane-associated protease RseP (regulator of RpoE activity)